MSIISDSLKKIKPSPTIAVTQKARELKAAGKDVIGLGAGEPDFDTPDNIKQAAIKAINDGDTKYTAVDGTAALKDAIVKKFKRENNLDYTADQITVGAGGKHVIYNAMMATLNEGDEVIVPAPYWVSYPDMVLLAGGTPIILECNEKQGFKINPAELEKSITPKTKWIILNSPSNPTGACYTEGDIKEIADVLAKYPHVYILSDDIYEHIYWGSEPLINLLNVCPDLAERCVLVNGVSKAYAMTGWRIGYAVGPEAIIAAMTNAQTESSSCASSISQAAALAALDGPQDLLQPMVQAYQQRHDYVIDQLNQISGLDALPSQGTFYTFVDCSVAMFHLNYAHDLQLVEDILAHTGVALVPGSAFGLPQHFRLSYATDLSILQQACKRLRLFFNR